MDLINARATIAAQAQEIEQLRAERDEARKECERVPGFKRSVLDSRIANQRSELAALNKRLAEAAQEIKRLKAWLDNATQASGEFSDRCWKRSPKNTMLDATTAYQSRARRTRCGCDVCDSSAYPRPAQTGREADMTPDIINWKIQISGYGTFDFEGTEVQAYARAEDKKRWERARNFLIWRADLARELDQVTAEVAALFVVGSGVPRKLFKRRGRLLREARKAIIDGGGERT